jgi:hypothetical protein
VAHQDAAARVRQRIRDWLEGEGHGGKKRLADAVSSRYGHKKGQSWVTGIVKGPGNKGQDLRLSDLDDVAEVMGVAPGELVRHPDKHCLEVTETEFRILQYVRAMPDTIRAGYVNWLDYLFKFKQTAMTEQSKERDRRTKRARRHEHNNARPHLT